MDSFTLQSSPVSPGGTQQVDLNILDAPYFKAGQTAYDTGTGFWIGIDGGTPKISFGSSSGNKVTWNGTTLAVTGTLTATTGFIGGWTINTDSLTDTAGAVGMSSAVTGGDDIRFWAGNATPASAPFYVTEAGVLVASSATITGAITATSGTIGSFTIGTYLYTGSKTAYNDANAGVHVGGDGIGIGNNVFTVSSAGALVATSATITGSVTATSGTIGGWSIGTDYIRDAAGAVGMSSAVTGGDDIRFWAGHVTPASAPFYVTEAGALVATSATISGSITATSGTIGGFTIGASTITATNLTLDASGQSITLGSGNDIIILDADDATYRIWVGHATAASAPFSVSKAGAATATNITITGGSVATAVLNGLVGLANTNINAQGWSQTSTFSVTDTDTVAWGAGTFTTAAGTAYSIGASNTGNMVAKTYIYLDIGVSTTAYQTTITASTSVGAGKVLVAVAQNNTSEAVFTVLTGMGGQNIDASNIVAASITGSEIAANTITAGNLTVSQLSAITADMGTITSGSLTLDSTGYVRSGQTDYQTGTGFFLGRSSGTTKFSIGNPSGNFLAWDGTSMTLAGGINTHGTFPVPITVLSGYQMLVFAHAHIDSVLTVEGEFVVFN